MPRERTLDERLRAVERSIDANATADPGPDHRRRALESDTGATTGPELVARPETSERDSQGGTETPGEQEDDRPRGAPRNAVRGRDGPVAGSSEAIGDQVEERLDALEAELAQLQAGLQAVRGYVGNIEHVNESVERQANAAMAAVERLESNSCSRSAPALATCPGYASPGETTGDNPAGSPGNPEQSKAREPLDASAGQEDGTESGSEAGLLDRLIDLL